MHISVSHSLKDDAKEATEEAFYDLTARMPGPPGFLLVFYTEVYNPQVICSTLFRLAPEIPVHGASSCRGIMTDSGFIPGRPGVLGLLGIHDPDGSYGVGLRSYGGNPERAAAEALVTSLKNAGRPGESPHFVWINSTPGHEEKLLAGIESVLGPNVPVLGGSAADDTISGNWSIMGDSTISKEGIAVTSVFSSVEPGFSFHSGYSPTSYFGAATKTDGRILREIDGRPAALVYDEWTGGAVTPALTKGGNVLEATNWYPLARFDHDLGKVPLYLLSHPERVLSDGSMTLFTDIEDNDKITLMTGNRKSLVNRAARVVESVLSNNDCRPEHITGALIVFCAGSMLAVQDDVDEVQSKIESVLGAVPFLTIFTFGEQGCLTEGANYHGNLMISVILFTNVPSAL